MAKERKVYIVVGIFKSAEKGRQWPSILAVFDNIKAATEYMADIKPDIGIGAVYSDIRLSTEKVYRQSRV